MLQLVMGCIWWAYMKWDPNGRLVQCAAESQNDKVGVIIPYGTCFNYHLWITYLITNHLEFLILNDHRMTIHSGTHPTNQTTLNQCLLLCSPDMVHVGHITYQFSHHHNTILDQLLHPTWILCNPNLWSDKIYHLTLWSNLELPRTWYQP